MSPADPERLIGERYRLVRLIATGGMGEVWQATDERLGRKVAVKVLKPEYGREPTFLARFRAEARHAAGLTHPGIAGVYDYGETQDGGQVLAYLVMELVDGEPLSQLLSRAGALPPALAMRIVGQTGLALQAAHDAGVIHRDIKPGNLLIVRVNREDPADVQVKVTDFGIARAVDAAPLTRTGMVMGTAHYLSPEQARAATITPSSDIYSLGVVAYECLTGARPFTGDTAFAIAAAHAHQAPPPLPADLPAPVRALVESAMAKEPAGRPPSAGAFGQAALALANQVGDAPATEPLPQDETATQLLPAAVVGPPMTQLLESVADPRPREPLPQQRRHRPVWPWLVALIVAAVAAASAYALTQSGSGTPSPGPSSSARPTTHATTSHAATTSHPATHSATVTTTKPSPKPSPSVTVNAASYVGRPYNEVATALAQLGLTPGPTSVATGGPPGTVTGVAPVGPVKAGSTITVQVVATPSAPATSANPPSGGPPSASAGPAPGPGNGKGDGKSHKPPHSKGSGGSGD